MVEIRRFFLSTTDSQNDNEVIIRGDEYKHISKVLRMRAGEKAVVCTAKEELLCEIKTITANEVFLNILSRQSLFSGYPVTLYFGLIKGDKTELALQKAVELGVQTIVPFTSKNTVVKSDDDKHSRYLRIAQEACKQCGRGAVEVSKPLDFAQMLKTARESEYLFICNEHEKQVFLPTKLAEIKTHGKIGIIVGSEGGFTHEEISLATAIGAISVSLGTTTLRAETAAIIASAFCCANFYGK